MKNQRNSFAIAAVAWLLAFLSTPAWAATGFGVSGDTVVDTRAVPQPVVTTLPATLIGSTSANLAGSVNRYGLSVAAWFEWGTSANTLTNRTPNRGIVGTGAVAMDERLVNLTAGLTYFYRVAAMKTGGAVQRGTVESFVAEDAVAKGAATVSVVASGRPSEVGTHTGFFTITRTGLTTAPLTVLVQMEGLALNGVDYDFIPGTITLPVGAKSGKVVLAPKQDNVTEGVENVVMRVMPSTAYRVGTAKAALSIRENDRLDASFLPFPSVGSGLNRRNFPMDTVGESTGASWYRINSVPPGTKMNLTVTGKWVSTKDDFGTIKGEVSYASKYKALDCGVALKLYDETGTVVGQSDYSGNNPEFISTVMERGGDYLVTVSFSDSPGLIREKKTQLILSVSAGENWSLVENVTDENGGEVHHVGLMRLPTTPEPQPGAPTWIVSHGRSDDPGTFLGIGKALRIAHPGSQVYLLDWRTASAIPTIYGVDYGNLTNGRWFVKIGNALGGCLAGEGTGFGRFNGGEMNYVGHSWGTYICYEVAKAMQDRALGDAARFVALDPAKEGLNYADSAVDFSTVSDYSMGFQSSDLGNEERVADCDDGFQINANTGITDVLKVKQHRVAHLAFLSLLKSNDPIGNLLKPRLFNNSVRAWKENPPNFHTVTHFKTGTRTTTFVGLVDDRFEGSFDTSGSDWHFANFYYEAGP